MADTTQQAPEMQARPGRLTEFWHYFRENRGAVFGLWVFAAFVTVAILADVIAPYDPTQQFRQNLLQPPFWQEGGTSAFLLGTDAVGRDMLSRLIHGSRYSFYVGIVVVTVAASGGILIGLIACGEALLGTMCLSAFLWINPTLILPKKTSKPHG